MPGQRPGMGRISHLSGTCPTLAGGDDGTRTHDLLVANQALYQLSYVPGKGRPSTLERDRANGWPRWIRTTDLTLIRRTL
jgi:hypothetical protein